MKIKKSLSGVIIGVVALATIAGLSGLNFLIPPRTQIDADLNADGRGNEIQPISMEKIFLTTKDGVKIAANYRDVDISKYREPRGWIVFLHMMPAQKESWDDLAKEFQSLGYESVAIDFRGHGESEAGPTGYQNFSDAEQQAKILDVEAGVEYLKGQRGAASDKISLIGASIGANLSLQYLSEHFEFKRAILLSPGLNYRGVKTEPLIKNLKAGQQVFFVASRDDGDNSGENQILYDAAPAGVQKQIKIYDTAGHGTAMLDKEPELKQLIIDFTR